ncbi:glycoside hydrolase family 25 [Ktedonobacter racemifer DSM 44963]|uniref:Glycoside hydrolase family 25 n=1 Tax=Ktedonobacter racemifer DSM 44963 TaxID=485913 RepID=D6TC76_KTERA|nr:glycoside hydrolase family 25 [Ktedonobacter racemifer DSM 44963]
MNKTREFLRRRVWRVVLVLFCLLIVAILLYTGIIWPNSWFVSKNNVQGLDVSSYQKQIDWKRVAQTGRYTFVFIKATEGKTYQDAYFRANWRGAKEQGLLRGAYHFYTASLNGAEQADNYINMVPKEAGMLPPVLDLEVSGKDRQAMLQEINVFLQRLEHHYGMKPIIYTDLTRYAEYIKGHFEDYVIWIGEALFPIQWSNVTNWAFWQYCDRGHVPGISEPVDLNVFSAGRDKLLELAYQSISYRGLQ